MDKGFYVGSLALTAVFLVLATAASIWTAPEGGNPFFMFVAALSVATHMVISFVVIHKMWSAIQDEHARMGPAKAIGLLFIPFFNLYWVYQVWKGFRDDYNSYLERYNLQIPHLDSELYHVVPTFMILSVVPLIGPILGLIGFIEFMALISNVCDAVNNLDKVKSIRANKPTRHGYAL